MVARASKRVGRKGCTGDRGKRGTERAKRDKRRDEDARGKCAREREEEEEEENGRVIEAQKEERASGWIGVADGGCMPYDEARQGGTRGFASGEEE